MMVKTPVCPECGKYSVLDGIDALGMFEWQALGKEIQRALPDLTDDEREMLISGIHPECWDIMFEEARY